jgi:hypothetical protein
MGQAAAQAAQQAPQVDTFDDADAFAWLDALEDDPLGVAPVENVSATESAESSQIKMEGEQLRGFRCAAVPRELPTGPARMPSRSDAERLFGGGRPSRGPPAPRTPPEVSAHPLPPPTAATAASGSMQAIPAMAPQQQVAWSMAPPPMAMPGFPPMYAAPWMMPPPPPMVAPMPPPPAPQQHVAAAPAPPTPAAAPAPPPAAPRKANPVANPGAAATLAAGGKHRKVSSRARAHRPRP